MLGIIDFDYRERAHESAKLKCYEMQPILRNYFLPFQSPASKSGLQNWEWPGVSRIFRGPTLNHFSSIIAYMEPTRGFHYRQEIALTFIVKGLRGKFKKDR